MRSSTLFFAVFRFLLPPALIATVLLYLYPAVQNCHFPAPTKHTTHDSETCLLNGSSSSSSSSNIQNAPHIAPFRLLALGDPQLEGDSSLPDPNAPKFPSLIGFGQRISSAHPTRAPAIIKATFQEVGSKDIPKLLSAWRKRLDLLGNDYYLRHVFRSVKWWTGPTHTVVLGDLLGSQWISDVEFERRADRFWNRVFWGQEKVEETIMDPMSGLDLGDGEDAAAVYSEYAEVIGGQEYETWKEKLINVAGNHDIGYAGDINERRIERFEEKFGKVNWNIRFLLPDGERSEGQGQHDEDMNAKQPPELELVVLNDMNLDRPAWQQDLREKSWNFLEEVIERVKKRKDHATVLLTHIPLFKEKGVCVDAPFFDHFPEGQGGGIREQNHLSWLTSRIMLDGLFGGEDKRGIVLNGHDHEGCDIYHHIPLQPSEAEEQEGWKATKYKYSRHWRDDEERHGVREVTVRSMMGSYWGNAGLLSAWFDHEEGIWKFEYDVCVLGVQHIWWAVHVVDVIVVLLGLASGVAFGLEAISGEKDTISRPRGIDGEEDKKTR